MRHKLGENVFPSTGQEHMRWRRPVAAPASGPGLGINHLTTASAEPTGRGGSRLIAGAASMIRRAREPIGGGSAEPVRAGRRRGAEAAAAIPAADAPFTKRPKNWGDIARGFERFFGIRPGMKPGEGMMLTATPGTKRREGAQLQPGVRLRWLGTPPEGAQPAPGFEQSRWSSQGAGYVTGERHGSKDDPLYLRPKNPQTADVVARLRPKLEQAERAFRAESSIENRDALRHAQSLYQGARQRHEAAAEITEYMLKTHTHPQSADSYKSIADAARKRLDDGHNNLTKYHQE
jgi:hypothetical protein